MTILGISCFYHDSAACLVKDGIVVAAAQEERFSRIKHDASFPTQSIEFCKSAVSEPIDYVVFYEKPFVKFERILTQVLTGIPQTYPLFRDTLLTWFGQKLWIKPMLSEHTGVTEDHILFVPHHVSHAASAFLCSPFSDATILTIDGVGEWSTSTISSAMRKPDGNATITIKKEMRFPHSVGLLYSVFTAFLGFHVNNGEYKVMGMSSYGTPRYVEKIKQLVDIHPDGSITLDLSYVSYHYHRSQSFSRKFTHLFGPARNPHVDYEPGTDDAQYYADIAASIQHVTEEIIMTMANYAKSIAPSNNLCLAGGVALNGVSNYKLLSSGKYKHMYIQPAAGDAGGAMGAALWANNQVNTRPQQFTLSHAYYGKSYTQEEIGHFIKARGITARKFKTQDTLIAFVVKQLIKQKVIGWFQGAFEWGPRALGARSIIADPRHESMKDVVNARVKFRELFRPFAPSVLADKAHTVFDVPKAKLKEQPFDYMLYVVPIKQDMKDKIAAVAHVDGSARPQLVHNKTNPLYYALIETFYEQTGVPLLLNTSFNLKGDAIVNSPEDAYETFLKSNIDYLVLGNHVIARRTV